MASAHDEFVLDHPSCSTVICPRCIGSGDDPDHAYICDLCEGEQEVPPILSAMYKQEQKSE